MKAHGVLSRLARLEDRLRPRGPRQIVIQWPGEPPPEVPKGADLIQVVYDDQREPEEI